MRFTGFRGKHNRTKTKLFLFLDLYFSTYQQYLTAGEVKLYLPSVSLNYLYTRLPQLAKWRYLGRRIATGYSGRPRYAYNLAQRGKDYLELVPVELSTELYGEIFLDCPQLEPGG